MDLRFVLNEEEWQKFDSGLGFIQLSSNISMKLELNFRAQIKKYFPELMDLCDADPKGPIGLKLSERKSALREDWEQIALIDSQDRLWSSLKYVNRKNPVARPLAFIGVLF